MGLTEEEINKIKYAVKPLTTEERARLRAKWSGQPVPEEVVVEKPTAGIPEEALKAKAVLFGVHVGDLTVEQIEEVRAKLPKARLKKLLKPVKTVRPAKK